jgi:hypothetical protein
MTVVADGGAGLWPAQRKRRSAKLQLDPTPNPAQPESKGVANPGKGGTKEGCLGLRLQTPGTGSSLTELGLALKNMAIARAAAT